MPTDNVQEFMSLKAAAAYTTYQYYMVQYAGTSGEGRVINNTGTVPVGVLYNEPDDGEAMQIAYKHGDTMLVIAGSTAITIGAKVGPNASGKAVPVTSDGEVMAGVAVQASGTANNIIAMHFEPRVLGTGGL